MTIVISGNLIPLHIIILKLYNHFTEVHTHEISTLSNQKLSYSQYLDRP